jgi:hypothetical protein
LSGRDDPGTKPDSGARDRVTAGNPKARPWRVVGRIAGRYLPNTPLCIGNVIVGPLPDGTEVLERVKGLKAAPVDDAHDTYFIGQGGDIDVKSRCYFWIDKTAKSPELALESALSDDIPLLQIAFSLRNDEIPYHIETLWATDGKQNYGNFAPSIKVTIWLPEEPSSAMLDTIQKDYQIRKTRNTVRNAAHFMAAAIRQDDVAGDDVAACESALLSYFKVIELIASRIAGETLPDREKRKQDILSRLQAILNSNKSVSKKASAVQDASTSLSRLEGRYLSLKIDSAAHKLAMSDDWKRAATELVNVRNTRLGHAASRTQGDEQALVQWSRIAKETGYTGLRLAREMLMAYVDRSHEHPR